MSVVPDKDDLIAYTTKSVIRMEKFCKKRFHLPDHWFVKLRLDFSPRRKTSYGGYAFHEDRIVGRISLAMNSLSQYYVKFFPEYASYASDKKIGAFVTDNWRTYIDALVAHEVSHCVQLSLPYLVCKLYVVGSKGYYTGIGKWEENHGDFFKTIYGILREEFVNHQILEENKGKQLENSFGIPKKKRRTINSEIKVKLDDKKIKAISSGIKFTHPKLGKCITVAYNPRAYKYPVEFKTPGGRIWKTTGPQFLSYAAAK